MAKKGLFITFEGIDGSGKTTQLELLYNELLSKKVDIVKVREPGSTSIGEKIRSLLSDKELAILPYTELLLFFSSRVQLIGEVIKPEIGTGRIILCDRFHDATVAYQSYGRGLSLDVVKMLEKTFVLPIKPDRTFLLDCSYDVARQRMFARSNKTRIEMMDRGFFDRVRNGYLAIAKQEQNRVVVMNANKGIDEIHKQIEDDFLKWAGL
jgi:dTMP kinase